MTVLVDASVVLDYLRGDEGAADLLEEERRTEVLNAEVAEEAGALRRRWVPSHHTIDAADLASPPRPA